MLVSLVNKAPILGYLFLSGSLEFSLFHFQEGPFSKGIEKLSARARSKVELCSGTTLVSASATAVIIIIAAVIIATTARD